MDKGIKNSLAKKRERLVSTIEKVKASIQPKIDALHKAIDDKTAALETELKFTDVMLKQIDDFEAITSGKKTIAQGSQEEAVETPEFLKKKHKL